MTDSLGLARRRLIPNRLQPGLRLAGAAVNADVILEPAWPDPRPTEAEPAPPVRTSGWLARSAPCGQPLPAGAAAILRVQDLGGLHWGRAPPRPGDGPEPRLRSDHLLIALTAGEAALCFPRQAYPLTGPRLAYLPAGTAFALRVQADARGWALMIPAAQAGGLPQTFRQGIPDPDDAAHLQQALRAGPDAAGLARVQALLPGSLARLRYEQADPAPADLARARRLCARFLGQLERGHQQGHTLAEYARDLGCSLAQLDRACRLSRGRPALELLYRFRLDRAARLLRETDAPVPVIAQKLGFSGPGHFARIFAAATGTTPEALRAQSRKERLSLATHPP
ncbi:helix-turn-helix domain-containing protein [Paracoccus limosus]|jgi:AraC family transcriptional activator of pobA|uniref:Helix-turn-helix domain-containing protein n=1 Tax=Paracoccus limosus TaxID=913252 RepID=A0A844H7C6_9RHOB|nr:AraC family transcriptional regulator [Paracoccus limosus]MTH34238.1 helix-turn-helix domain-containing protein [Paracoccus limosus]